MSGRDDEQTVSGARTAERGWNFSQRLIADRTEPGEPVLSVRTTCRVAALLYLGCGSLVMAAAGFVSFGPGSSRPALALVGLAASVCGAIIWFLPWGRWKPRTSLWLIPLAFSLIALQDSFSGNDGFVYALFFMVALVWVGLAHPPRTSLAVSPLLVVAYFAPLLWVSRPDPAGLWGAFYVIPACVIVGESVAWVAAQLRRSEAEHLRGESYFRELFAANPQAMWVYHRETLRFLEVNDAAVRRYGYSRSQFLNMDLTGIRPREEVDRLLHSTTADREPLEETGPWRHRLADGTVVYVEVSSRLISFDGAPAVLVSIHDVTARMALEDQLREQAFHDPLTGLANRNLFAERIDQALSGGPNVARVAVLLLDLDGFKTVNDSLGHSAGDQVLLAFAERLSSALGPHDTAARLGGDEFAVLLPDTGGERGARDVASAILKALERPLRVSGMDFVVSASIGIATPGIGAATAEELLRNADSAMYAAKVAGRGRFAVFEKSMYAAAVRRMELDAEMRAAIAERQFILHFQPEVEIEGRRIVGVESLVRWQHPERGLMLPGEFIRRAEENGLIVAIGDFVLDASCARLAEWGRRSGPTPFVAVNLSAHQLVRPELFATVEQAVNRHGADPSRLVLEVTESAILTDTDLIRRNLERVRALGARIALDDFGTGYSSLTHLRALPIDVVKIDRSFVADLVPTPGSRRGRRANESMVAAILRLTESLGITTVAEGVETEEQLRILSEMGCDLAQGYLFSTPRPAAEIDGLICLQPAPAA